MCIDPAKTYTAKVVDTDKGKFTVALDPKKAPKTVNNFVVLSAVPLLRRAHLPPRRARLRRPGRRPERHGSGRARLHVRGRAARARCPTTRRARWRWPTPDRTPTAASSSSRWPTRASTAPTYSLFGQVTEGFDTTVKALEAAGAAGADAVHQVGDDHRELTRPSRSGRAPPAHSPAGTRRRRRRRLTRPAARPATRPLTPPATRPARLAFRRRGRPRRRASTSGRRNARGLRRPGGSPRGSRRRV